jgi:hypothetical protein
MVSSALWHSVLRVGCCCCSRCRCTLGSRCWGARTLPLRQSATRALPRCWTCLLHSARSCRQSWSTPSAFGCPPRRSRDHEGGHHPGRFNQPAMLLLCSSLLLTASVLKHRTASGPCSECSECSGRSRWHLQQTMLAGRAAAAGSSGGAGNYERQGGVLACVWG